MTDQPISLAAKRFNSGSRIPCDHSPRDAVAAFLAAWDAGEINPNHVIIVHQENRENGSSHVGWFQAGKGCNDAQIGMLHRCAHLMQT